ncbi:MAG: hypothetical protein J4G17_12715 [Anaerolineae bacterium]|nr:hypothetical protein [Anaerolineae bacterium]
MKALGHDLLDCGLLQFGQIGKEPWRLHVELLPSYPELLHELASLTEPYVQGVDRLLAANGAQAWGNALAMRQRIPLVYCQGDELVGAYDIGHPALLLACGHEQDVELLALMRSAGRVGLEVCALVSLLDSGRDRLGKVPVHALLDFEELVQDLVSGGALPAGQGRQVERWLFNRRQGLAGP